MDTHRMPPHAGPRAQQHHGRALAESRRRAPRERARRLRRATVIPLDDGTQEVIAPPPPAGRRLSGLAAEDSRRR